MAYDTLDTVVSGEPVATDWGNQVKANFDAFDGTSYTPTLTATTTNPTLGTGSSAKGSYVKVGNLVIGWFSIRFGTSGVSAGSGTYSVSLPTTPSASLFDGTLHGIGQAVIFDNSAAGNTQPATLRNNGVLRAGTVNVTDALPWTWAAQDSIEGFFVYLEA